MLLCFFFRAAKLETSQSLSVQQSVFSQFKNMIFTKRYTAVLLQYICIPGRKSGAEKICEKSSSG